MEKNKRNSLWLATQYSVSLLLSLIGLKLNLLTFGGPAFSIWLLIFSIWGVGAAVDFGFGISTVKFVAQYRNDSARINKIVSTGFYLFMILGVLILLIGFGCAEVFYFHNVKLIPEQSVQSSRTICYLSGATFYISYLAIVFRSVLEGHDDFALSSKISLSYSLVTFTFILITFLFHATLIHLAVFYVIAAAAQFLVYYLAVRKRYPRLQISITHANIATFRETVRFSVSVQIAYFFGSLIDPVTKYIIGNFSQNRLIPPYEIAKRFSLAVSGLFGFSFKNALPNVSKLKTQKEYVDYFFSYGVTISRLGIFYSGFFFGILSIVFCGIFKYFYGYSESIIIFLLFALAESINSAGFIVYVFILGIGRSDFLALLQLLNVTMISLFLCIGYICFGNSIGLLGFYVSVLCGNVAMILFVKKRIHISITDFCRRIKITKLVILNFLMLLTMFTILRYSTFWLISQLVLSGICIWLFHDEIGMFYKRAHDFGISSLRKNG